MDNMTFHLQNKDRNGVVDILGTRPEKSFPLFYEEKNTENASRSLGNIHGSNPLNKTFFSPQNVDLLQDTIRKSVFDRSNGVHIIGRQSDIELKIIMRSIYLQYSKNMSNNIDSQIKILNELVVNVCVPKIITNVEQYLGYKQDISKLPTPMPRSQNLSSAGTKSTRMTRF